MVATARGAALAIAQGNALSVPRITPMSARHKTLRQDRLKIRIKAPLDRPGMPTYIRFNVGRPASERHEKILIRFTSAILPSNGGYFRFCLNKAFSRVKEIFLELMTRSDRS